MWLTINERTALSVVGAILLAGMGTLWWQRRQPPSFDVTQGGVLSGVEGPPVQVVEAGTSTQAAVWDARLAAARAVDVNTADAAELERLPGVGPALAMRIVAYRSVHGPFASPEELTRVAGIGEGLYERLRGYVTIESKE